MEMLAETYVEKLPTGAIVLISGEYAPVDKQDNPASNELLFLGFGETTPNIGKQEVDWKLIEAFDFAS